MALTKDEIEKLSALRGRPIVVCPLCGDEVAAPEKAHDVRKLGTFEGKLAHAACVRAREQR